MKYIDLNDFVGHLTPEQTINLFNIIVVQLDVNEIIAGLRRLGPADRDEIVASLE